MPTGRASFDVVTLPYPGLPTDLQPQAIALLSVADGDAMITENLFEARFMFCDEIARMGADVRTDGHHAVVRGRERLSGAPVRATDIRAGVGLVIAGLVAEGVTEVAEIHHIDRGYVRFEEQLRALGRRRRAGRVGHVRQLTQPVSSARARAESSRNTRTSTSPLRRRDMDVRMPASPSVARTCIASARDRSAAMTSSMPRSVDSAASTGRPVRGREGLKAQRMTTPSRLRAARAVMKVGRSAPTSLILALARAGAQARFRVHRLIRCGRRSRG